MRTALHWVCWQPTPYNDFLFRSLAAESGLDFRAHFLEGALASHPWRTPLGVGYSSRVMSRVLGVDAHLLGRAWREPESFFVVAGWHAPALLALLAELAALGRRFAVLTDTPDTRRRRSPLKGAARSALLRSIFRRAEVVLGTGRPALAALASMGASEEKLVSLPFYVDLETFKPRPEARRAAESDEVVFVSSGRLENSHKGHDLALRALGRLARRGLSRFRCRIAGVGPDEAMLRDLAESEGVADQVEFLGWLEPSLLPDFYASGDALLHTSHFDPFPNAVLEAMACGLPVIGSDAAGSVADRVEHGRSGLVHRDDDLDDLTEQLAWAMTRRERLPEMGIEARRAAEAWPVSHGVRTVLDVVCRSRHV